MRKLGSRLLMTSPPEPDESLTGYLVRLSTLNNYKGPAWILSAAGLAKGQGTWKWPSFVFRHSVELKNLGERIFFSREIPLTPGS